MLTSGTHSVDIAILSNFETADPKYVSKAQVTIKRFAFERTTAGGATECLKCPEGQISNGTSAFCTYCPAGRIPNADQTACVVCPDNMFNPYKGGTCTKCPDYSYSAEAGTSCLPYDVISNR